MRRSIIPANRTLIDRFWNVILVGSAITAGVLVPHLGQYTDALVTPLVVFLVYGSLRGLRLDELEVASYALVVLLALAVGYVLLPAGGIFVANAVLAENAVVGFAIALSVPTTAGSAIVWTRFSRGDVQLATTISVVSLLVAPLATPVVLTHLVGSQAGVPATSIVVDLLTIILGGVLLVGLVPSSAVSARTVDRGATVAIVLLVYTSVAGVELGTVSSRTLLSILAAAAVVLGFGLAIAVVVERLFGLERTQTLPLFYASSLKNLGIALLIALSYSSPLVSLSVVAYYAVQQVFGAVIADVV